MTVPTLINNYQKRATVVKLKKAYTDLSKAIKFSEAQYGDINSWNWDLDNQAFFDKYFSHYIKIKQTTKNNEDISYYRLSGQKETNFSPISNPNIIITKSVYWILYNRHTDYISLLIDINGADKPNTFGKDLFVYFLFKDKNLLIPHAWSDGGEDNPITNRNILKNGPSYNSYQCNKNARGMWCAALIMADGWEIKNDYPW